MTDAAGLPSVAVVIPCYNHGRFLPDAITSVLNQRYVAVECVVVNDGSTDDTVSVATRHGVRVIDQPHRGVSEARNAGVAAVGCEFVVFLDADDELLPDAIGDGVTALTADPDAAAVVGRCEVVDVNGRPMPVVYPSVDPSNMYEQWLSKNFVWTPGAAMFRRRSLLEIGGFPVGLGPAADYAVYLTLARGGRVKYRPASIVRYRQHPSSMSRDPVLMLRSTLAVLRRERQNAPMAMRRRIRSSQQPWCDWYGEQIVHQLRSDWHAGRRGTKQVVAIMTLLHRCRRVALRHAWRKMRLTAATVWHVARTHTRRGTARRNVVGD